MVMLEEGFLEGVKRPLEEEWMVVIVKVDVFFLLRATKKCSFV